ncbi:MAG: rhomboid family intramembrane serine protease, partial [Chitinophagaceae bacterium]
MLSKKFKFLFGICVVMIFVHILNVLLSYRLNQYGISPRQLSSVWSIFAAPFLHGNVYHLLNNLFGLCLFSAFYFLHSLKRYVISCLFIITVTGILVWFFGRNATHIGASGWVFGLWSLCIATAWFERRFLNIVIAFIVVLFYGGVI